MSNTSHTLTGHTEKWIHAILSGEEDLPLDGSKSLCQRIYECLGNSKKTLVTLCIGLKTSDNTPLINIEKSPWCLEAKVNIKPANKDLATEVLRRQRLFLQCELVEKVGEDIKPLKMKPKNKAREVLIEWLNDWPIIDPACVEFLTAEATRVHDIMQSAINESRENLLAMQHGAWCGQTPYLRLVHCIIDSDASRSAYLRRNEVKTREQIDATNSPLLCKTAYDKVIAECWNNPDFNPSTYASQCHSDFAEEISLSYSKVATLVPPDSLAIQNRLSNIRATLLRIIDKWEQSGQGDGGRMADLEADRPQGWGTLEGRTQQALDNRANFLGDAPSLYLYFWEAADKYQLLGSTLQRLNVTVGASSGNTPTLGVARVRRQQQQSDSVTGKSIELNSNPGESWDGSAEKINAVLQSLIDSSEKDRLQERELHIKKRVDVVNDSIENYQVQYALTEKAIYQDLIAKKSEELKQLESELKDIEQLRKRKIDAD